MFVYRYINLFFLWLRLLPSIQLKHCNILLSFTIKIITVSQWEIRTTNHIKLKHHLSTTTQMTKTLKLFLVTLSSFSLFMALELHPTVNVHAVGPTLLKNYSPIQQHNIFIPYKRHIIEAIQAKGKSSDNEELYNSDNLLITIQGNYDLTIKGEAWNITIDIRNIGIFHSPSQLSVDNGTQYYHIRLGNFVSKFSLKIGEKTTINMDGGTAILIQLKDPKSRPCIPLEVAVVPLDALDNHDLTTTDFLPDKTTYPVLSQCRYTSRHHSF